MEKRKKGLGRGLGALIKSQKEGLDIQPESTERIKTLLQVSIKDLVPNPYQARTIFREDLLEELAASISQHGILQPIIIAQQQSDEKVPYIIIAGERRWRAAKKAGLSHIPALCIEVDTHKNIEAALSENIQREDLSPIDFAKSLNAYLEISSYTHEDIAEKLGKSRPSITNALRLLSLPTNIQDAIHKGIISQSHARLLLSLEKQKQLLAFDKIVSLALNIRDSEKLIHFLHDKKLPKNKKQKKKTLPALIKEVEQQLIEKYGTKVSVSGTLEEGHISLHFYSQEDLNHLLTQLGISLS